MADMEIFHGSNVIVEHPQILENGFYKDFGYGFYCTQIEKQAKRWALTKRKNHIINKYKYPTHQIVFCTEKALDTLTFEGSYSL